MEKFDVIILGAGAAGMFAARESALRGRRTLVLDHAKAPGEKIRISGGGRCNFTNMYIEGHKYLGANPRFALSALKRYTQWDFIAEVDAAGIAWHEKTLGQLFCDNSAKDIIKLLTDGLTKAGAELRLGVSVDAVRKRDTHYVVSTNQGKFQSDAVIVATGGKSIPKMGATGIGYQIAQNFDLPIIPTRAGLVPLTLEGQLKEDVKAIAGASVSSSVSNARTRFDEGLLFTHRGLSGPSILQISSYWHEGEAITIDLCAGRQIDEELAGMKKDAGRISIKNAIARIVPEKLAVQIVERANVTGTLADQSKKHLEQIAQSVHQWDVTPSGSEGYRTAEVTLGGVDTDHINAKTMESKAHNGLYFIGEVVDITGWLGGYNFQWAWSSGWAAGQVA